MAEIEKKINVDASTAKSSSNTSFQCQKPLHLSLSHHHEFTPARISLE